MNGLKWYGSFARRNGAGIAELIDVTGYHHYGEAIQDMSRYEMELMARSIEARNQQQQPDLGGLR